MNVEGCASGTWDSPSVLEVGVCESMRACVHTCACVCTRARVHIHSHRATLLFSRSGVCEHACIRMRAGEMYLCGIGSLGAMLDLDGGEAEVCMDTYLCSV